MLTEIDVKISKSSNEAFALGRDNVIRLDKTRK